MAGWGECASPSDPYYCPETTETCWHMLRDFLVPLVLGREWTSIDELTAYYRAVKGNNFARSGLEIGLLGRARSLTELGVGRRCSEAPAPRSFRG